MARMLLRISAAVALLLMAGSAAGAPDLQGSHRACIQASSGGHTYYYDLRTSVAGTTLDRWTVDGGVAYVDRNTYAAFHLPEGGVPTWDEGVSFAATMQTRNVWLNNEPINTATWMFDANAAEDTMLFRTTVNAGAQDFVFRTSQCLSLEAPGGSTPVPQPPATTAAPATDVPSGGQEPNEPPAAAVVRACLQASSAGVTYYYEIASDLANDAAGTTFDRYSVAGGVDTFVDSNTFAALRNLDPSLPWDQGVQFANTMQSRNVWVNTAATSSASIAHDDVSGVDTLTFRTTVNGGAQDYIFSSNQCR